MTLGAKKKLIFPLTLTLSPIGGEGKNGSYLMLLVLYPSLPQAGNRK
jgi:hypothetical protein